jgi:ribosomal protein S18 acetylase RimI-like enzyme
LVIRSYRPRDEGEVIALWRACNLVVPWNDPHKDVERMCREDPEDFLVGEIEGEIAASVMFGYDGHRGWVHYLAVHPRHRRQGLGRVLMDELERRLRRRGCPKINLQVRLSNEEAVGFYRAIGYTIDAVLSMGKRLEHDGPPDG